MRLQRRTALVTGGASGIGRAICIRYAQEGAKILVADLRSSSLTASESDSTHDHINQAGGEAHFYTLDVTNSDNVDAAVQKAVELWGRLDIMVNNAGIAHGMPMSVWEVTNESWDKHMNVNASGTFYGIRAAAKQMIKQDVLPSGDRGWIINLGSVYSVVGAQMSLPYSTSKHAVLGLTRNAALDLGAHKVHVNAILPGLVGSNLSSIVMSLPGVTPIFEQRQCLGGIGKPEDVARIAVFLASDDARLVTGAGISMDGGFTAQ